MTTSPETTTHSQASFFDRWDARLLEQPKKIALYLFSISLLVQFLYLSQYAVSPFFWVPQLDGLYHDRWAKEILAGEPRPVPYFRAPLYYYFLAGIYSVFGPNMWAVHLMQAVVGALSCVMLYRIGEKVGVRPSVSALACILMAFYGPLVFQIGELHLTSLELFFDLLLILLALNRGVPWAFASGIALGASAIVRPNILSVVPVLLWWFWYREGQAEKSGVLRRWIPLAAVFLFGASLGPAATTLRNGLVTGGDYVFIASQGPVCFYIGNRPEADGFTAATPTRYRFNTVYEDSVELYAQRAAEEALGRKLTVRETQKYWTQRGLDWWKANPGAGVVLTLKKWGMAWNRVEIRNNTSFDYIRQEWASMLWVCAIGFWFAGPFGALGMAVTWKRPGLRFLTVFILFYMLSFLPFIIADRYRMPIIPLFLLLSACAIEWLIGQFTVVRNQTSPLAPAAKRSLGIGLAGLAAMAVFVNGNWFPTMTPALWAADYWNAGNRFRIQNKYPEAEEQYVKAVKIDSKNHEIWNNLGEVQYYQERIPEAMQSFGQAVRLRPEYSDGYYNLALCYLAAKQTTPARELLKEAIRRDPENEQARKELQALESGVPPAAPTAVSAARSGAPMSGPGQ